MEEEKTVKITFYFKDDSPNYHRLFVQANENKIKGTIYIPKGSVIPNWIVLERG